MSSMASAVYLVLVVSHLAVIVGLARAKARTGRDHSGWQWIAAALSVLTDLVSQIG